LHSSILAANIGMLKSDFLTRYWLSASCVYRMLKSFPSILTILISFLLAIVSTAQTPDVVKPDPAKSARVPLKKCWDYLYQAGAGQLVAGFQDRIFISEAEGRLRAVSSLSTDTIWVSELGGRFVALTVSERGGVFVLTISGESTSASAVLRLVDLSSGLVKFSVPMSVQEPHFLYSIGNRLVVAGKSGEVEAFDASSGSSLWKSRVGGRIVSSPTGLENILAFPTESKKVDFLSVADGTLLSSVATDREIKELTFRANQMLVVGDDRGNVTNYRDQSGSVWWKFKSGARTGTIVETDEGIVVGSYDNFVYLISKYSGDVRWKRRLDGRVIHRPLVVGKELVFTVSGEEDLVLLDAESGKILEQTAFGEGRYPVGDPILMDRGVFVFPLVGGIAGFSVNGCK
jgi:hypothetical protein